MDSDVPTASPAPAPQIPENGGALGNVAVALLCLIPFALVVWLVETYFVNIPFYDDFTFVKDWIKLKEGTLSVGELFTAHMEHRVAVPRILALAMHVVLGKSLIWQCRMSLLLLLGMGWNLAVLLCRSTGLPLRRLALPLFTMSGLLFCAIQWQALLWPIMFEVFIPLFCITLVLRIWFATSLSTVPAFVTSLVCAMASAWSFGTGLLLFPLTAMAIWWARPEWTARQRGRLIGLWMGCALVAGILYALNPENAVEPEFAYEQGHEVTVAAALKSLSPSAVVYFMAGLLGSHLSRGLHVPNIQAAEWLGFLSLGVFVFFGVLWWLLRKFEGTLKAGAPWILLALFSIGTSGLIAIGRSRLTHSNALAITGRYVCHAIPLTLALIALAVVLWSSIKLRSARLFAKFRRDPALESHRAIQSRLQPLGGLLAGLLLMLTSMEWVYGSRLMELWSMARWQDTALILFAKPLPQHDFLGPVCGNGDHCFKWVSDMDRHQLLPFPLLEGDSPQQPPSIRVSKRELRHSQGKLESLTRRVETGPDGKPRTILTVSGYSQLADSRPADLVIFTVGSDPATARIFGLCTVNSLPQDEDKFTKRDHEFMPIARWDPDLTARWSGTVSTIPGNIPDKDDDIDAWAFDVRRRLLYHIEDGRTQPSPRLPKGVAPGPE